jgi:hypothetical protein
VYGTENFISSKSDVNHLEGSGHIWSRKIMALI